MPPLELLLIAIGLGADAFSVALAVGAAHKGFRPTFRLSFHFGLFQFMMPLLGWGLSRQFLDRIAAYDHWVAFGVLSLIAARMLLESLRHEEKEDSNAADATRGWMLVGLSLAVSIDALGVGVTMGFMQSGHVYASVIIGIVACLMTLVGMKLAQRVGPKLGTRCEQVGAIVLFAVAVMMLFA